MVKFPYVHCNKHSRNSVQRETFYAFGHKVFSLEMQLTAAKGLHKLDLYQLLASMILRHLNTVYILELLGLKTFKGQSLQCRETAST